MGFSLYDTRPVFIERLRNAFLAQVMVFVAIFGRSLFCLPTHEHHPIMPTNTPTTKEDLITQIELLQRKEKARRVIAIAIGGELHETMDAWSVMLADGAAEFMLDVTIEKADQFNTAMKEWRESVAQLQAARTQLKELSK